MAVSDDSTSQQQRPQMTLVIGEDDAIANGPSFSRRSASLTDENQNSHLLKVDEYLSTSLNQIHTSLDSLIKCIGFKALIGEYSQQQEELDLEVLHLLSLKHQVNFQCTKARELLELIDHCGDEGSLAKLWEISGLSRGEFANQATTSSEVPSLALLRKTTEFTKYKAQIWDIMHPDSAMPPAFLEQPEDANEEEADLIYCNEIRRIPTKCPLSQQPLKEPVKNAYCQHVFSKEAILAHISISHNSTCPVSGCSANVGRETLHPDKEVQEKLDRMAIQALLQEAAQEE